MLQPILNLENQRISFYVTSFAGGVTGKVPLIACVRNVLSGGAFAQGPDGLQGAYFLSRSFARSPGPVRFGCISILRAGVFKPFCYAPHRRKPAPEFSDHGPT
jgi:hypothetical protein